MDDEKTMAEHKIRVMKFDKVNSNNTIISKDAFKDQDDKPVPLIWRCEGNAEKLGTANLEICDDGVYASIDEETYKKLLRRKINEKDTNII